LCGQSLSPQQLSTIYCKRHNSPPNRALCSNNGKPRIYVPIRVGYIEAQAGPGALRIVRMNIVSCSTSPTQNDPATIHYVSDRERSSVSYPLLLRIQTRRRLNSCELSVLKLIQSKSCPFSQPISHAFRSSVGVVQVRVYDTMRTRKLDRNGFFVLEYSNHYNGAEFSKVQSGRG